MGATKYSNDVKRGVEDDDKDSPAWPCRRVQDDYDYEGKVPVFRFFRPFRKCA